MRWENIAKTYRQIPVPHWWEHMFHNVINENSFYWEDKKNPIYFCKDCEVWWRKGAV